MFSDPVFLVTPLLVYLVPVVVITVLAYLVLRFAIRDGLRAHARWLERRAAQAPPASSAPGVSQSGE